MLIFNILDLFHNFMIQRYNYSAVPAKQVSARTTESIKRMLYVNNRNRLLLHTPYNL